MDRPKTRTRYVHVNSLHRHQQSSNDPVDMDVHLHRPIKNVLRCHVKQFSMGNTFHNVRTGENVLKWAEFYEPDGTSGYVGKVFSVAIPPGYYEADILCATINTLIANMSNHKVSTDDVQEQPLGMTFSQDTQFYTIKIDFTNTSPKSKWFCPVGRKHTIWDKLGFVDNQVVNANKRKIIGFSQQTGSSKHGDFIEGFIADNIASLIGAGGQHMDENATHEIAPGINSHIKGVMPTLIESPSSIYLCSDALTSGSTFESRNNPEHTHTECVPMPILEYIQFTTSRFSHFHYSAKLPHYHYLNEQNISRFDIQLKSGDGNPLYFNEVGQFNLVLTFETVDHDEFSEEFVKAYNQQGYEMLHRPDNIKI